MTAKKKIVFTFLLAIILCAALKIFLRDAAENKNNAERFWTYKTHNKTKYNIVVFGDSRVYRGVSPDIITQHTKLSSVNLGYSSAGYSEEILNFIDTRLKKDSAIVVLGITANSLSEEGAKNEHYFSIKNQNQFTVFKNLQLTPLLSFFNPYKISVIAGITPKEKINSYYYNNGWAIVTNMPQQTDAAVDIYRKSFAKNKISEEAIKSLLERVKKWHGENVRVIGFRPPTSAKMLALEDSICNKEYENIKNIFIRNGGEWLELNNNDYNSYDGSHLDFPSAIMLSHNIAAFLEKK